MLPKSVVSLVLLTLALPVSAEAASHHDDKQGGGTTDTSQAAPKVALPHGHVVAPKNPHAHAKPEAARPRVPVRAHVTPKKQDKHEKIALVTKPKPAVPVHGSNSVSGYEPVVMMSKPLPSLPKPIAAVVRPAHRDPKLDTNHEPKLDPKQHDPNEHEAPKATARESKPVETKANPKADSKHPEPTHADAKVEAKKPEAKKPEAKKPEATTEAEPEATKEVAPAEHVAPKKVTKADPRPEPKLDGKPEKASMQEAKEPELAKVTSRTPATVSAKIAKPALASCVHEPVEISRGTEGEKFSLTRCDGSVAPMAVERLSVLARPGSAERPADLTPLAKIKGAELAPGVLRIDPKLVERLQSVVDHFSKIGAALKITVVSGYRPSASGSYHASGRALDFRIEGVHNEALVAFCKTIPDTGCGYYPNSSFVHLDVRDPATGHVSWIDASSTGETPRYVVKWPPPEPEAKKKVVEEPLAKLDKEAPAAVTDDHPAQVVDKEEPTAEAETTEKTE